MKLPWRKNNDTYDEGIGENDACQGMASAYDTKCDTTRCVSPVPLVTRDDYRVAYTGGASEAFGESGAVDHVTDHATNYTDNYYDGYCESDLPLDYRAESETLLLNRYVVSGEAGSGTFASVVIAWDTRIQRQVAIKCIPLEETEGLSAHGGSILVDDSSFDMSSVTGLEEARTAAMLSDPSIVSVYDFEVDNGMAYLILEYVDGLTLADLLARYPDEINADIVASVFKSISHALEVAHKRHVLHLDIKPGNVLIDQQGQVKVTDFGLARLATESGYGTAAGGTIGYMPPEQMTGQELDERCDQWALASLTYEMIAGKNPFVVESLTEAEDAIYDAELIIPSLCMEGLDEDIDDIMFCALDPDPTERYDSVKDFAEQLQPCLGSTRKGKNALKRLVGQSGAESELIDSEYDDDTEAFDYDDADDYSEEELEAELEPWHMSARMRLVCMRLWATAGVAVLGFLSINSVLGPQAWTSQPLAWGALVAFAVITAIFPHVGALVVGEAFGIALCAKGAPLPGILLMAATGAWWFYSARHSVEATNAGLSAVLFGAIGLAPLVPFVAGFLLSMRDAIISTLYALCLAVMLAGLGSASLIGWDALTFVFMPIDSSFTDVLIRVVSVPSTWIMILALVLAALASSLLCGFGKRVWCITGMLLAGALLIVGLICGSLIDTMGREFLTDPYLLAPVIGSTVLAVILVSVALPGRTMSDYEE